MPLRGQAAGGDSSPEASVVIPSYQAARHIRHALTALMLQETTVSYEIIVVDSSTDETASIVAEEFPDVRLVRSAERLQVGSARNVGVQAARGSIVLFADADTVPCETWLEQMCSAITVQGADAAGGSMCNGTPWSITGSAGFYLEFFQFLGYAAPPRYTRYVVGGNSAFRRALLYDRPYLDHSVGEDMYFSSRLAVEGKKLLFVPRARSLHRNRTGLRVVIHYQRKLGHGAFLYRSAENSPPFRLLAAAPPMVFLLPFVVLPWIGWTILRRRQFADFLRFGVALPVCFAGNSIWALGFYEAARARAQASRIQEPS